MRFIAMVKSDEQSEAGVMADEQLLSAMGKYNERLIKAGMMLGGDGLTASAKGARVKVRGKKFSVFDGPFAEAKELVGGFWLLQAKSKDEVVEWMKQVPFRDGEIEIRALYGPDDFPKDPSEQAGNWREQETKARAETGAPARGRAQAGHHPLDAAAEGGQAVRGGRTAHRGGHERHGGAHGRHGQGRGDAGGRGPEADLPGRQGPVRRRQAHGRRRAVRRVQGADRRLPGAADRDPAGGRASGPSAGCRSTSTTSPAWRSRKSRSAGCRSWRTTR